jgi:magnesium-dependent phosphatase-1
MCQLAIFDMDQTLVDETLYHDVEDVLEHLKKNNIKMAIASYNPYAQWLCERYSITHNFDIICGYHNSKGKMMHIEEIKKYYFKKNKTIPEIEILFFDDDPNNINEIKKHTKIKCVLVPEGGLTLQLVLENLEKFSKCYT